MFIFKHAWWQACSCRFQNARLHSDVARCIYIKPLLLYDRLLHVRTPHPHLDQNTVNQDRKDSLIHRNQIPSNTGIANNHQSADPEVRGHSTHTILLWPVNDRWWLRRAGKEIAAFLSASHSKKSRMGRSAHVKPWHVCSRSCSHHRGLLLSDAAQTSWRYWVRIWNDPHDLEGA